jgi:hypothetical protein
VRARRMTIAAKTKPYPIAVADMGDFTADDAGSVDPLLVLRDPTLSLYCVDMVNRRAVFVQTPPGTDFDRAPFFYQAQYEAATALVTVPFDTMHQLADEVVLDADRLILVYSVGRCGSTLVSRLLGEAPGVCGRSEPDVFTQLVGLRTSVRVAEFERLLRSCVQLTCVADQQAGWALKFRNYGIDLAGSLTRQYPKARVVFLYRGATSWAQAFVRAFGNLPTHDEKQMRYLVYSLGRLEPALARYARTRNGLLTEAEFLGCQWASFMDQAKGMSEDGTPMFAARYEELSSRPHEVIAALFAHCGVTPPEPATLDRILAGDSQEGSTLARDAVPGDAAGIDPAELAGVIADVAPRIHPDTLL